jgi:hypothetical protein
VANIETRRSEKVPDPGIDVKDVMVWQGPAVLWAGDAGGVDDSKLRHNCTSFSGWQEWRRARQRRDAVVADHRGHNVGIRLRHSIELREMPDVEQVERAEQ